MSEATQGEEGVDLQRGRPWLLSYNRRLRHLHEISLRNLSFSTASSRRRSSSVDDEAIPQSLQSPAKLVAQKERVLEHSHSSTDLPAIQEAGGKASSTTENGINKTPVRPGTKRLRRRSTLEWVTASPATRQKKLQEMMQAGLLESFFSLHTATETDPVYVSEAAEESMNPNFAPFDLNLLGSHVTRCDEVVVKVWARHHGEPEFQLLVELDINLRYLHFIGKTISSFRHPLPPNCILFHMTDGVYTVLITGLSDVPKEPISAPRRGSTIKTQPTSSYDALMRLSTLDVCIQDALATRSKIEDQINRLLEENMEEMDTVSSVDTAKHSASEIEGFARRELKAVEATKKRRDHLVASLKERHDLIELGRSREDQERKDMNSETESITARNEAARQTREDIHGQQRRICEDLLRIFPIEPVEGKSLAFTIRGLELPNSEYEDANDEVISAALGHVAQVVYQLSFYLLVPLPYPIHCRGSSSSIEDPISATTGQTAYPLFAKGTARFRFEYGVFLLNKNIEIIANNIGLKIMDLRQTLPNLKYLLYVATAGPGELPARKIGGLRAFLRVGPRSALGSRKGSMDSTTSSMDGRRLPTLSIASPLAKAAGLNLATGNMNQKLTGKAPMSPVDSNGSIRGPRHQAMD